MSDNKQIASFIYDSMDNLAGEKYGEFGYSTLTKEEQLDIIEEMLELKIIT